MSTLSARPYTEPAIVEILVLASFLLLSNVVDSVLNRLLYCGLVGQILIGVAWGTPGGHFLPENVQDAVTQFGYLGLILIVYEGGLATNLQALRGDLALSLLVALVGTTLPIALSFTLQGFLNASALQAFAAGASLCSTSLGTTFTVLSASGLDESRLGVVLTSAAMMDDVVGLMMSGVISSLGSSASSFGAVTVIRPVLVSLAYAILLPAMCTWIIKPLTIYIINTAAHTSNGRVAAFVKQEGTALCLYALVLVGFVTSASYAGTSELFAAYLAGVVTTWWDDLIRSSGVARINAVHDQGKSEATGSSVPATGTATPSTQGSSRRKGQQGDTPASQNGRAGCDSCVQKNPSGLLIYDKYFRSATGYILKPFFFASIGFAIPISQLFSGSVVWRGVVYSILMFIAKMFCGLALVRFNLPKLPRRWLRQSSSLLDIRSCWPFKAHIDGPRPVSQQAPINNRPQPPAGGQQTQAPTPASAPAPASHAHPPTPRSLYPAALLGSAMVARGEIGFLISSIAETDGIFGDGDDTGSSEIFLVTTWAILICTIVGPVIVGTLVRRVRRLQTQERQRQTGKGDPLGPWGICSH